MSAWLTGPFGLLRARSRLLVAVGLRSPGLAGSQLPGLATTTCTPRHELLTVKQLSSRPARGNSCCCC